MKLCDYLVRDSTSYGPEKGFDSMYFKRILDDYFNMELLLKYYSKDTSVYDVNTKLGNLRGSIGYLDVMLDEAGLSGIKLSPAYSRKQIESMDAGERAMYQNALNIHAILSKRKILIGVALFDEKCKLTGYLNTIIGVNDAKVLREIIERRKRLQQ